MGLRQLGKNVVAGVLCMSMLCVNAVAAEETEDSVREITYEQAVQMVINNDVTMENLAQQITYLQDNKLDMFVENGGGNEPEIPPQAQFVDSQRMTFLSTVYSYTNSIEVSKLSKQITEISAGAVVKQYFSTLDSAQSSLNLAKENYEVQKQLYSQGQMKHELGYLSDMDYAQLSRDTDEAKRAVELLELNIANTYTELNKLLGIKNNQKYVLVNDVEFEPVVLSTNIDDYATRKVSSDLSLRIQALSVDSAEFEAKVVADSTSVGSYRTKTYNYESASRAYEEAKKQKNVYIHSAYIQLQQLEKNRANLISTLESAESALEKAKINYEVGNITKLVYDQAKLAVTKAEDALKANTLSHDMLKYTFDNTCILGNVGGATE